MAMIRTNKRENPFVQIDKTFTEDPKLKWVSKGIMSYLLSRPDNWKVRREDLEKRSADGRTVVETALLDLMLNGYIYYWSERGEDGTIKEWIYEIYESPEFNPHLEESIAKATEIIEKKKERNKKKNDKRLGKKVVENPDTGNPHLDKKVENQPDADYPKQDIHPDAGYPEMDSPVLDNPHYNNNELNNKDFTNNEITNNKSIYLKKIEELDIDKVIKNILYKTIDRLIDDQINLDEIELNWQLEKHSQSGLNKYQYADMLFIAFTTVKKSIGSQGKFSNFLKAAVKKYKEQYVYPALASSPSQITKEEMKEFDKRADSFITDKPLTQNDTKAIALSVIKEVIEEFGSAKKASPSWFIEKDAIKRLQNSLNEQEAILYWNEYKDFVLFQIETKQRIKPA
ncbi:MAG TPA: hypothetical protein VNM69_06475 [Bacillus sp. (in: firmicutes)]|nr:hypothetical protein [Bacillus sp. (in: firmicutes)]